MTSIVPDPALRSFLEEATARYQRELPGNPVAVEYLRSRGLSEGSAAFFRLGYVENPLPGHEVARGMLAVPYLTRAGVTTIRFRRLGDGDGPKYRSMPGDPPRIYNAGSLLIPSDHIAICEGEFDAIAATTAGIPAVGIGGVSAWKPYFARCFKGYRAVYILADQDDKGQGMEFAEKVAEQIKNARITPMPVGHDVNSFTVVYGSDALLDLLEMK